MKSKVIKSTNFFSGRFLKLEEIDWIDGEGNKRKWEVVRRTTGNEIVSIVAVTGEKNVILVSQFRPSVGKYVIEFPAGLCDLTGEAVVDSARRELQEETGYLAESMQKLFVGTISVGLSSEYLTVFLARDLKFVGKKDGREERGITVYEIPIEEVENWINEKKSEGMMSDVKIFGHLSYVEKILRK
ncbi:MAG: NUDIX hydrolase [Candidatus Pacebacteria bacterium]|nr:NUDIX hydrolase [Candidatus Paceibacterota bacterium]